MKVYSIIKKATLICEISKRISRQNARADIIKILYRPDIAVRITMFYLTKGLAMAMKKSIKSIPQILTSILLVFTLTVNTAAQSASAAKTSTGIDSVVINEICSSNKKSLKDADGSAPDWIELYNSGSKSVSLKGAGLSDDKNELHKWVFPDVTITSGEYLIVFASDKDKKGKELHTNFKLSGGNDTLYLSSADKKIVRSVPLPATREDETYGRYPNAKGDFRVLSATPGKTNDSVKASSVSIAAPIFSKQSGFYNDNFNLSITSEKGMTIYYTTNGSVPTKSSTKYTKAIQINDRSNEIAKLTYVKGETVDKAGEYFPSSEFEKATVIRAIAVDKNGKVSPVSTATYFVGSDIANKYKGASVISVVADPKDLMDSKKGIFVAGDVFDDWRKKNPNGELNGDTPANFNQRGREWERDAHVDFFDRLDTEFSIDCGMRVHGGWSRNSQQKSMKFYMRSEYGESKLSYKLFNNNYSLDDGKEIKSYKRFMIRNGGNDNATLKFKDPWTQSLVSDFNFATQKDRLVICFLNGEYWGVYTLGEVYDDNYIESKYGVPADDVIMVKVGELEEGIEGDLDTFNEARRFVQNNDMSNAANYKKACELFDMDSVADYFAVETYIANDDWLWNNWAIWRSRTADSSNGKYSDGKWRFMLYDTEFSMDLYGSGRNYKTDILKTVSKNGGYFGRMFTSLLKNNEFKTKFVLAMEKTANVAFNPVSASDALTKYYNEYSPYLDQHFKRYIGWQSAWGVGNNTASFKQWLTNRNEYFATMLKNDLKLKSDKTNRVSISVENSSGGTVYLENSKLTMKNGKWSGNFLGGYKITLKAVPKAGYEFAGWSGSYNGSEPAIKINPTSSCSFTAKFVKKK